MLYKKKLPESNSGIVGFGAAREMREITKDVLKIQMNLSSRASTAIIKTTLRLTLVKSCLRVRIVVALICIANREVYNC